MEIDKLTKGRALVPVTDLMVERCNEIIRDAKTIVEGDSYLDRVKEFVPAGDNPVYPDILITARTVLESMDLFKQNLETRKKRKGELFQEAQTIQVHTLTRTSRLRVFGPFDFPLGCARGFGESPA